jgi:hypothetical protein
MSHAAASPSSPRICSVSQAFGGDGAGEAARFGGGAGRGAGRGAGSLAAGGVGGATGAGRAGSGVAARYCD